jgi:hypothetical protein
MSTSSGENADYTLQAKTKAVVFTHINLRPEDIEQRGQTACIKKYVPLFERYLKCRNVGLVYMYLSLGAEEIVRAIVGGRPLEIPPEVLEAETECRGILELAEARARKTHSGTLKFVPVATTQLLALFSNLHDIDPGLFGFLFGKRSKHFTFDSPKFVEAVIRIARGQDPRSAHYPIVRFDEDVQVSEKSLDILLAAYEDFLAEHNNLYFFFSGSYGDPDDPDKLDPINDRAVRAHWFVDAGFHPIEDQIKLFWRDLGEVGATQLGANASPSLRGLNLITERGFTVNRMTPQVISGAGLIMSLRAIQDLPPFMNMNSLVVWVDDDLKRQLHERINDIYYPGDLESVLEARFKQDRHPEGITQRDIDWAASDGGYFERLLAGCMMDSLISHSVVKNNIVARTPTEFAQAIKAIIANPSAQVNYGAMQPQLYDYAERRYGRVLELWQTPEFEGTVLHKWAHDRAQDENYRKTQVTAIVEDAGAYLELVKNWRGSFAAAIGRLRPIGNLWLFERVA